MRFHLLLWWRQKTISSFKNVNFMSQTLNSVDLVVVIMVVWFQKKKKQPKQTKKNQLKRYLIQGIPVPEIYFVLLAFTHYDFVWCWDYIIKQIFHFPFCLISKLFAIIQIISEASVIPKNEFIPLSRLICKSVSENWLAASWYLLRLATTKTRQNEIWANIVKRT